MKSEPAPRNDRPNGSGPYGTTVDGVVDGVDATHLILIPSLLFMQIVNGVKCTVFPKICILCLSSKWAGLFLSPHSYRYFFVRISFRCLYRLVFAIGKYILYIPYIYIDLKAKPNTSSSGRYDMPGEASTRR